MSQRNSLDLLSRKEGMCLLEQSMGFVWQAALRAVAVLGVADRLVEGKIRQTTGEGVECRR